MLKRFVAVLMVVVSLLSWTTMTASASELSVSDVNAMCANLEQESVTIDGVTYTYHYYYTSDGNRAIDVTYSNSTKTDTVVYNSTTSELFLNGKVLSEKNKATRVTNGWETLSTDTVTISWEPGIATGLLAAMIAGAIGAVTSNAVVGALGGGLAFLATQAFSATIYIDSQWLHVPPAMPQYRMIWTLVDSNGKSYGPFISQYTV